MGLALERYRPEPEGLDSAISRREGLFLSVGAHVLLLLALLYGPNLPFIRAMLDRIEEARARAVEEQVQRVQPEEEAPQWAFATPRLPPPQPPPRDALLSDSDGVARSRERPREPRNPLPYSRGDSPSLVDEPEREARARGQGPSEVPAPPAPAQPATEMARSETTSAEDALRLQEAERARAAAERSASPPAAPQASTPGGRLGEALRNIERYLPGEVMSNSQGGAQFGQDFDFDRKGVEFGPWIRYFRAQVRANWLIPDAAALMRGHVVITLNVWKDGRISDVQVVRPSGVDAFDRAAANALRWSNPTRPLPREYPDEKVFFTVTFYYNETPPLR
jgi:TonB family protein